MAPVIATKKLAVKAVHRVRRPATRDVQTLPVGMVISPITGLPVVAARQDLPPLTSEMVRAALLDHP